VEQGSYNHIIPIEAWWSKLRILVSNDDGIEAPGLLALESALKRAGHEVLVAAPHKERSGSSHSFSLRRMLRIREAGRDRYSVSGTPVDAVHIAVKHLFRDRRPQLVVSGINLGANLGCDINYSGTAAAAREGALLEIPAFAVSLDVDKGKSPPDFSAAARFAVYLSAFIRERGLHPRSFLNVNLPDLPEHELKGVRVTRLGVRNYGDMIHVIEDPFGENCYWMGGAASGGTDIADSDIAAVAERYISVCPLDLDSTMREEVERLSKQLSSEEWPGDGGERVRGPAGKDGPNPDREARD